MWHARHAIKQLAEALQGGDAHEVRHIGEVLVEGRPAHAGTLHDIGNRGRAPVRSQVGPDRLNEGGAGAKGAWVDGVRACHERLIYICKLDFARGATPPTLSLVAAIHCTALLAEQMQPAGGVAADFLFWCVVAHAWASR
jgi:hypothetical protein